MLGTRNTGCGSTGAFDPSGGEYHRQSLAGDVLIDGTSQGIAIEETHPGLFWGRSAVLGLSICWEYGHLRWWDPAAQRYLETHDQTTERADAARGSGSRRRGPGSGTGGRDPPPPANLTNLTACRSSDGPLFAGRTRHN